MRTVTILLATAALAGAAAKPDGPDQVSAARVSGWMAMGRGAEVRDASDPGAGHASAIALTYEIRRGQISAALKPAMAALAGMERLRFWIKTDRETPVGVLLSEQKPGGGNYTAWVWSRGAVWQQVELTPADFILADGPNDPRDPDGKLDLDRLEAVGVFDMAGFFPALAGEAAGAGAHTLWIDGFEAIGGTPAPQAGMTIDNFDRGFLSWIAATGAKLELVPAANPLGEPAMQVTYDRKDQPFPSIVRRIGNFDLASATRLEFDIASDQDTTIAIGLEMNRPGSAQGPRFNLPIYPPEKREVFHVSVKLEAFQGQGKLDPAQLKSLLLTDTSAAGSGDLGPNTIWIGNVRFR